LTGQQWRRCKVLIKFLGVHITDKLKWSTHTVWWRRHNGAF
jgi:hypothetical protein